MWMIFAATLNNSLVDEITKALWWTATVQNYQNKIIKWKKKTPSRVKFAIDNEAAEDIKQNNIAKRNIKRI